MLALAPAVGALLASLTAASPAASLVDGPVGAPVDAVTTEVKAMVSADLDRIGLEVHTIYRPATPVDAVSIILAADRYRDPPDVRASTERELFPGRFDPGGFEALRVTIDGRPCEAAPERLAASGSGERVITCPLGAPSSAPIAVDVAAVLDVPRRYGPFGLHHRLLTLGGAWYPYVSRAGGPAPRGRHHVVVDLPTRLGAVIGRTYFAPSGDTTPARRVLERTEPDTTSVPLVVLPPSAGATPAAEDARVVFVSKRGVRVKEPEARTTFEAQTVWAATDAIRFLREEHLPLPDPAEPIVLVEAPLRHELARATDGPVLVSDHAFRILPFERFFRLHRLPVLRELFTVWALRRLEATGRDDRARMHFAADAIGAWLLDRYVASRLGVAENAFDVLSVFSFIPAIDTMLYAPELPFVEAYFRVISEADPLVPNLIDFPSPLPRGKQVYEKLLDRLGTTGVSRVFGRLLGGADLDEATRPELGADTTEFLATWVAPYPGVRYHLADHGSAPAPRGACGREGECWLARAAIEREGARVAEPIEVRLRDENGLERIVRAAATSSTSRTVTATLSAPLSLVELDPRGRLAQLPTADDPSPRFHGRDPHKWKLLLNNFNLQLLASEQAVDTALDLGIARVHDVRWAFAVRGDYEPQAIALSGRGSYSFGHAVTPARLSSWIGFMAEGAYLRPGFGRGASACGVDQSRAMAVSGALTLGYDDRPSVWAPDAGTGLRASLAYTRVLGELTECSGGAPRDVPADALSLQLKALEAWRVGGAHLFSLRAKVGGYAVGAPREQLLFALGGRANVRGYRSDAVLGRYEAIASAEWEHTLFGELDEDFVHFTWVQGLDGALYADAAVLVQDLDQLGHAPVLADVGYGLRLYIDYFGVRPGVMALDVAFPLVDPDGRARVGAPAVYIDFAQSFLAF